VSGSDIVVTLPAGGAMFTGLIECAGSLVSLRRGGESAVLEVAAPLPAAEVKNW